MWTAEELAEIVEAVAGTKAGAENWPDLAAAGWTRAEIERAVEGAETIPDALEMADSAARKLAA